MIKLGLLLSGALSFQAAAIDAQGLHSRGVMLYEQGRYEQAAQAFKQAIATEPSSRSYHWLGKSYGQLAERASLVKAFHLARQTRHALEKAVKMDAGNREAIEDLIEYYKQAPAIVGGDPEKARWLRKHFAKLDSREEGGSASEHPSYNGS